MNRPLALPPRREQMTREIEIEGWEIIISAGDSAPIRVKFAVNDSQGAVQHTVDYSTNDPRLPSFSLVVKANVKPSL